MDWSKSYTSIWRVYKVNRKTWADGEQLSKVDDASVSRTADGRALESGSLEVSGRFESDYYRIVLITKQGGRQERVPIATLLFEVNGGSIDFGRTIHSVDGYSVLHPAETTAVTLGEYAPAGVDGAQYAASLLRSAINAPVVVEGSFTLNNHVVHELGSSVLDAAWAVLDAGGFVIQIDGDGTVYIRPKPTQPAMVLSSATQRLLSPGIDFSSDMSDIPNRYIVIDDTNLTIATNNNPDSIVSTVSRGYFVDVVDTSPMPVNGKTLNEYAVDRLKALSVLLDERTYTREYNPSVYVYSLVRASINGLQGDLRVLSQSLSCKNGITVNEKAAREIALWMTS